MAKPCIEIDAQELWALLEDEFALLPGMTDKGRLGFALQLKFRQINGRFPERNDEIDRIAAEWVAAQVSVPVSTWSGSTTR